MADPDADPALEAAVQGSRETVRALREAARTRRQLWLPDRRTLLIGGGAIGALAVGWAFWPRDVRPGINLAPGEQAFAPFIKISRDGRVTLLCPQTECGQGVYSALAQVAADELGADWRAMAVEPAAISAAYANPAFFADDNRIVTPRMGVPDAVATWPGWRALADADAPTAMLTGRSTTLSGHADAVRTCAAITRVLLAKAAAARWNVRWEECDAHSGFIHHGARRLRFGELAREAAEQTPPELPPYRVSDDHSLMGEALPRLDLPAKIDGSLGFAGDIRLPDQLFASVRQGPHGDSRLLGFDAEGARNVRGFVTAVRHERWLAAVARDSWAAMRALDALAPRFRTSGALPSSSTIDRRLAAALDAVDGARIHSVGDTAEAMRGRSAFRADMQAAPALHAEPETPVATAQFDGARVRIWIATAAPAHCRRAVAGALGLSERDVTILVTAGGGSIESRYGAEVAVQAALVARAVGRPVTLMWSRVESLIRDWPRAPARARMAATLSSGATVDALHIALAAAPARHEFAARLGGERAHAAQASARGARDADAVSGLMPPYRIPHIAIDHLPVDTALPAGAWRGGAESSNIFFLETFIDELATAARVDPMSFRMGMLGDAPRLARCLQSATALAGWDGGSEGSGQGIACALLRGGAIALTAVARRSERGVLVERLVAAVDIGRVLNPTLARQQIEGGLIYGLAMAMGATARYRRGLPMARRLAQLNLPLLKHSPQISIEILPSDAEPAGVEDLAVPLVAPAIANALFTTTGMRFHRLPLSEKPLD